MNIRVYDKELNTKDYFKARSLQWTRKFGDYGSFELHISREKIADIRKNDIISADKDRLCGIVKRIYCNDNDVTISGYDLKGLCLQRVDIGAHSGAAGKIITDMAVEALTVGKRAIPGLEVEASPLGEEITTGNETAKLSAKIEAICAENALGYDIIKAGKKFIFRVLSPHDRSRELLFAPKRKNISSAEYEENGLTGGVTFVYNVKTANEKTEITEYDTGAEGIDRVESFTTDSGEAEDIAAAMKKAVADSTVEATVSAIIKPEGYRTSFDLGDYVTVSPGIIGGEEIMAVKLITEVKEVYEHGRVTITPTFGTKAKSFIRRLLEQ